METVLEKPSKNRIFIDAKDIRKKVRKEGYRESMVEDCRLHKKEKYPKKVYDSLYEDDED